MGNIVVYEAISRVVKDNNVIGLMVILQEIALF